MSDSTIIAVGSIAKHRGAYDGNTTYYYQNQCTMYGSVFEALHDSFSGVPPLSVAADGSVSLANTEMWQCIVNNVNLYNKMLSTNSLDARITKVEDSVKTLEEMKTKMEIVVQDSKSDSIDNYSEVISFLDGMKNNQKLNTLLTSIRDNISGNSKDIVNLELKHINPHVTISGNTVVEFVDGSQSKVNLTANFVADEGDTSKMDNLAYQCNSSLGITPTLTDNHNELDIVLAYDKPETDTISVGCQYLYKGVDSGTDFTKCVVNCVKASYVGYSLVNDATIDVSGANIQKAVVKKFNGAYNVTNATGQQANFFVAVPKNGNVDAVKSIIQRSSMNVNLPFDVVESDNYTFYVCKTKHNEGTYTFVIS